MSLSKQNNLLFKFNLLIEAIEGVNVLDKMVSAKYIVEPFTGKDVMFHKNINSYLNQIYKEKQEISELLRFYSAIHIDSLMDILNSYEKKYQHHLDLLSKYKNFNEVCPINSSFI